MKTPARKLSTVRSTWRERRHERARRLRLDRELASYATPAERQELDAILSRHTAEQTREVDTILVKQAVRHRNSTRPHR